MTKQEIFSKFFSIEGNHESEKNKYIISNVLKYRRENEEDTQIEDAYRVIKMWRNEANGDEVDTFTTSREIVAPALNRLIARKDWDLYDIRILSLIVDLAETYVQSHGLTIDALAKLKELHPDKKLPVTRLAFHVCMLQRLLRSKFTEDNDPNELEEMFNFHYEAIMEICSEDKNKFAIQMAVALVRKSIFLIDNKASDVGPGAASDFGQADVFKILKNEISEYEALAGRKTRKETRYRIFLD